jgi:hypothetical protein
MQGSLTFEEWTGAWIIEEIGYFFGASSSSHLFHDS